MEWTIAFGPGGGNDIMARTIVDILQKDDLYPENIVVENREGGSGATGWGYLLGQSGTGYGISTTSGSFITTPLQADTGWTYDDFTPVGPAGSGQRPAADARAERDHRPRGLGRATPRTRARSSSAASAPSTSTTSCTR